MPHGQTREQLETAIAVLDGQRALLGDTVVDSALASLRADLAQLLAQVPPQQLKQVTLLFVDVVGSTAMGQRLDPEALFAVMDHALVRFTAIVRSHRGRVLNYTGDGLLAAFGSEGAREDDVESAILAGLGILEDAKRWSPQVRQAHGVADFEVRAGVHTGMALLGGGVQADANVRGDSVNIAARMEQSAPPGRLRISHPSYRHVRGLFDVVEQTPIEVKGVDRPLRTYLVERARPSASRTLTRGVDGVATPLIGREGDVARLRSVFDAVVAERDSRAIAIVGDAGLGKSRLVAGFRESLDPERTALLVGGAHPRSAQDALGLVRDMLRRYLGIVDDDPVEQARQLLEEGLASLAAADGDAPVHLLGQLIGLDYSHSEHVRDLLDNEASFQDRAFDAAATMIRRLGARKTVVVVVDDLHWADEGSIAFLRHLLRTGRGVPLMVLALARPAFFEIHPNVIGADPRDVRIDLAPLDDDDCRALADSLVRRIPGAPPALRDLVMVAGEGNPFAMEELVNLLVDDGVIQAGPGGWRVDAARLSATRVPPTLFGILQARLDALPPSARLAVQRAAVIGHVFWDAVLAAIDPAAVDALQVLVDRQIVLRRATSSIDGADEFAFQHHLLHQATYDSVLKADKRDCHTRAGDYWSKRAEVAAPTEVTPSSCRALSEAHYHRCQADAGACVDWFERVFTVYLDAYAARTLRPLAEQEIDVCERLFGAEHPATARALTNLARVSLQQGHPEEAEPRLRRALAIQERSLPHDHPDSARTLAVLGGFHRARGDWPAARDHFERALDIRERVLGPDDRLTLGTLDHLAAILTQMGELDAAERTFRRILEARERNEGPDHPETAFAMTALAEVVGKRGELPAAEALIRRALATQERQLHDRHPDLGLSLWHLAEVVRGQARFGEAEPIVRRALDIWTAHFGPDHEWTAWGLVSLAEILLAKGAAGDAAAHAGDAAGIMARVFGAEHPVLGSTLELHARALQSLDDHRAAEPLLVRALAIRKAHASPDDPGVQAIDALLRHTRDRLGRG